MAQAKKGDTVKVHYTGKLEDGTVFDSSVERGPLEFTLGKNEVIPGFEEAVAGLEPGRAVTVQVPAEKGYGKRRQDLLVEVERAQFAPDVEPKVGRQVEIQKQSGEKTVATIRAVDNSTVTLDANHPLAGRKLIFHIKLLEIA